MRALTKRELERQDFVDNEVFELIQRLAPSAKIKWDIEMIGKVRDSIFSAVSGKVGGLNERQFYP